MSEAQCICEWAQSHDLHRIYHNEEWGLPTFDDRTLFEFLILEGAQAGLNWLTVLKKREGYRKAFADFDPELVAQFDEDKIATLLTDEGIIRNKLKVRSAVRNARVFLQIQEEFGSFSAYYWAFVDGKPIINNWATAQEVPASTPLSDQISKDLKKRGMNFVGSTIMYAYMQATGMVNDHTTDCYRWAEVQTH